MSAIATSNFRKNRKQLLVKYCGGKCQLCGYHKTMRALCFHHINEQDKEYGIASNGTCHNIDKDITQVKKTILLCANCHAEVHEGFYSVEELINKQFFDESVIDEYKQSKEKKSNYCKNCGIKISNGANYCMKCSQENQRVTERPDRKTLKSLIRTMPFTQIAKKYGVTDNAIRKWCISMSLPSKKTEINSYSQQVWKEI